METMTAHILKEFLTLSLLLFLVFSRQLQWSSGVVVAAVVFPELLAVGGRLRRLQRHAEQERR